MTRIAEDLVRGTALIEKALDKPTLAPDLQAAVMVELELALADYEQAIAVQVETGEHRILADRMITGWKQQQKALQDARLARTRPLDAEKAAIMDAFSGPLMRREKAISAVAAAVLDYDRKQEEIAAKAKAEAAKALERGDGAAVRAALMSVPVTELGAQQMRDHWVAEIEDEALLPREYLVPNVALINLTVRTQKDKTNIPGVKAVNQPSLVTTRRSVSRG